MGDRCIGCRGQAISYSDDSSDPATGNHAGGKSRLQGYDLKPLLLILPLTALKSNYHTPAHGAARWATLTVIV